MKFPMYRVCFVTLPYTSKVEQQAILSILKKMLLPQLNNY